MWFNAIGLYGHVTGDVVWLRFGASTGKQLDLHLLTRLPDVGLTSLHFTLLPFLFTLPSLPS